MSGEEIKEIDRRLTGVENTISPLVKELRSLTESNVHLTSEIKHLVKTVEKTTEEASKLEEKVTENTKEIAVMKSKNQWQEWVGRAIVTTIVTGILAAVFYVKG